jgi:hypothetical protein
MKKALTPFHKPQPPGAKRTGNPTGKISRKVTQTSKRGAASAEFQRVSRIRGQLPPEIQNLTAEELLLKLQEKNCEIGQPDLVSSGRDAQVWRAGRHVQPIARRRLADDDRTRAFKRQSRCWPFRCLEFTRPLLPSSAPAGGQV